MRAAAAPLLLLAVVAAGVSPPQPPSPFSFYNLSTPLSGPCDICTGPDGALWVQNILVDKIARVDPATGDVEEYSIPYTLPPLNASLLPGFTGGRTALACAIRPGNDGNIYAASGIRNQFLRINVTTRKIDVFTPTPYNPLGDLQPFNDLTAGPDGMFFSQTTANVISHFNYASEVFTIYPLPTPLSAPLGMIYFKDYLWFAELLGNKIGRLDPNDGSITEYPLTLSLLGPAVVRVALSNPDRVCFTAFLAGANGCLNINTGEIEVYPNTGLLPGLSLPSENTKDGREGYEDIIYYSTATQNYINILNATSGEILKIVEPYTLLAEPLSLPIYLDIGINYGPGEAVWFTQATANRVGRYCLGINC
ncbi:soluble quino protein glucose dehydrogenase [Gymnopus androsaceus JB14]|uniref:Soluble quino protein glucose dehydrogenase n=1 Tax=Gymnopus androsaceus JB14 TaxID=1447944 RepID=A0A6A4GMQ8_9AGAR|nr:soluble quino protein glucose dehydrogenase [Gymnopus androsaceus JB14]